MVSAPSSSRRDALFARFEALGIDHQTYDHEPVFTVEQGRDMKAQWPGAHSKNLFLKDKKGNYFLLTAQEDTQVNLKTLHKLLGGASRFSFGKAEMMEEYLGVTPGAVTAFGIINDRGGNVTFAIDQRLLEHEKINCHPLVNTATTTILCDDLLTFAKACDHAPMIVDLSTEL